MTATAILTMGAAGVAFSDGTSSADASPAAPAANVATASSGMRSVAARFIASRRTLTNPVADVDAADPFVLRAEGRYWAFVTNHPDGNVPVLVSDDLQHWTSAGDALPQLPPWAVPNSWLAHLTWAPAVAPVPGGYAMYYTAGVQDAGRECVSVAFATQVEGPYVDSSSGPLVCQLDLGGSIDPDPFVDADGTRYLVWKSDGNCCQIPTILWSQALSGDGLHLVGSPSELLRNEQAWEGDTIEAPELLHIGDRYELLYSGNHWDTSSYAVGQARCDGPVGPCGRTSEGPLLTSSGRMAGPGGATAFADEFGHWRVAVHAWPADAVAQPAPGRQLWILRLDTNANGLVITVQP